MKLTRASLTPFALPLAHPLRTSTQRLTQRSGVLLQLTDSNGLCGLGEATPIAGFGLESAAEAHAALGEFLPTLLGQPDQPISVALRNFRIEHPQAVSARAALDSALCDLAAQRKGLSLAVWITARFGISPRKSVPVNALLVEETPAALTKEVSRRRAEGYRTLKIKVGFGNIEQDCARVALVRATAGPAMNIRLDANGAWNSEQARDALRALSTQGIELVEQPVAADDLDALTDLRAHALVPIAADEAAGSAEAARAVIEREAADFIVLKPSAVGGIHDALRIAELARATSVRLILTTLLDGAIGRVVALHLAAAVLADEGERAPACGLATGMLLAHDFAPTEEAIQGEIPVPTAPGLGVQLDHAALDRLATGPTEVIA